MEDNKKEFDGTVEYVVHESILARMERVNKRLFALCVIIFLALIATNAGWIVYESQFEDTITVTQDTPNGNNSYVGRDGNITNGTADNNQNP